MLSRLRTLLALLGVTVAILTTSCATQPKPAEPVASVSPAETQPAPPPPDPRAEYLAKLPPLIDRDLFFGDPQLASAQISPNGELVAFRKPYKNVMNVWVKKKDEPFDAAHPVTADTERPVNTFFWSRDSRYVLYAQDKGGNENYHVYAVDPTIAPDATTGAPPPRDLTPLPKVRAMIYDVPAKTPGQIIIGLNDRDPALHDVYRLDIATGKKTLLVKNTANVAAWVVDQNGNVHIAWRQTPDGGSEILPVKDGVVGKAIYSCSFEETCQPIAFHRDNKHVYIETNKGAENDLSALALLNPSTGQVNIIESDPEKQVDFGQPIFSEKTHELIGTAYVGDRVRIYPKNEEFARVVNDLHQKFPNGELGFTSITSDDRLSIVTVSSDVDPGSAYLYDWQTGDIQKLYASRPELPSESLAPMRAIRYRARDGREIPAYLTLPKGVGEKNLPTIILPHGGPWGRDIWGYSSIAQFLANRGYAVLQPNFRASVGFGKAHLNAGNNEWGTGAMQHDLSDGVKYLVDQGIADPKRVAIMGGSYGGYATLAGLAFTPELYAAGVDIVGPSNISTLLKSIPPYWGPIKKMFDLRVGNPDDPKDQQRLHDQSPLFRAQEIKAPLLVIQGANDPRVNKREADQIVVALRDLGRDVQYMVAPDEGHGFAGLENRMAMFAAIEKFLAEHLGGRYQESMSDAIAKKLAAITVDPKTVAVEVK